MPRKKRSSVRESEGAVQDSSAVSPATATAPDQFRALLIALATDPAHLGEYIKDPDGAMRKAGISDVDQVVLKSGQPWMIHARLSGQRFSFAPSTPAGTPSAMPAAMLVVDMVRPAGASDAAAADQPAVRVQPAQSNPNQGAAAMFPNTPVQAPVQIQQPELGSSRIFCRKRAGSALRSTRLFINPHRGLKLRWGAISNAKNRMAKADELS